MTAQKGLIHFYYGSGKGKTTAAMGLALRASGSGKKVMIVQFLKNRNSCEVKQLEALENITVLRGQASDAFSIRMTAEEKHLTAKIHNENLKKAVSSARSGECELLVLDEALDAYQLGLLDEKLFMSVVTDKPDGLELVITGHTPEAWLIEQADYVSEMLKKKHPYDKGVNGRKGIEF